MPLANPWESGPFEPGNAIPDSPESLFQIETSEIQQAAETVYLQLGRVGSFNRDDPEQRSYHELPTEFGNRRVYFHLFNHHLYDKMYRVIVNDEENLLNGSRQLIIRDFITSYYPEEIFCTRSELERGRYETSWTRQPDTGPILYVTDYRGTLKELTVVKGKDYRRIFSDNADSYTNELSNLFDHLQTKKSRLLELHAVLSGLTESFYDPLVSLRKQHS